jgi:hypothetical protein
MQTSLYFYNARRSDSAEAPESNYQIAIQHIAYAQL